MKFKAWIGLAIGLALLSPIAACTPEPSTPVSSAETSSEPRRSVAHAMGTTDVVETPKRVVVLTNEATDIVLALGVTPVGAVRSWSGDPYYDYIAADMTTVDIVGDELQPNLESIAALNPDLILGSKVRQRGIYRRLNKIAPTVFSETIGATWKDNVTLYAEALGRSEQADVLLAEWDNRVADFKQKLGDQIIETSLVRLMPGAARVYYKDSFPGQVVDEVGLARPASQDKKGFAQPVSQEQIPQMDGDAIFYFVFTGTEAEQPVSTITEPWLQQPLWQQLDAVQQGNVYAVDDAIWTASSGIKAANLLLDDLYTHLDP
ncbi:MAG: iron-siderophore ABC transporter substrate-binding protein [Cyanobacteria bacterium P01_D01_bin.56]